MLEDYFEFFDPDDIRIKGYRIGIENVIQYYLQGYSPEQILEELPSLNLEEINVLPLPACSKENFWFYICSQQRVYGSKRCISSSC